MTNDLKWSSHISKVCAKAKSKLGMLYRHFHTADTMTLSFLYKALVLPHLDYCSCVWDPPSSGNINILESVQKFAARLCTKRWDDPYTSLLTTLSWTPLSSRRSQQKVTLCRRILKGESILPPASFSLHPHPNPRLNHHDQLLTVPFARTVSFQSSFFVSVVRLWNSLPSEIISCASLFTFKKHFILKNMIIISFM